MKVYVGTCAKYNDGNLFGAWLDLEDYTDKDEFVEACKALHADEEDPEFMFQDQEGIPDQYFSESHIAPEVWDILNHPSDIEVVLSGLELGIPLGAIKEAYLGKHDSMVAYAQEYASNIDIFGDCPDVVQRYFDWNAFARDLKSDVLQGDNNHYFNANY